MVCYLSYLVHEGFDSEDAFHEVAYFAARDTVFYRVTLVGVCSIDAVEGTREVSAVRAVASDESPELVIWEFPRETPLAGTLLVPLQQGERPILFFVAGLT